MPIMPQEIARQWFVPGDGIDRHVISADIQRYLGNDATVRPGVGTGDNQVSYSVGTSCCVGVKRRDLCLSSIWSIESSRPRTKCARSENDVEQIPDVGSMHQEPHVTLAWL